MSRPSWGKSVLSSTGRDISVYRPRKASSSTITDSLKTRVLLPTGWVPLGVEFVANKGFVCRGVVLDAVALRGRRLPISETNSAEELGIVTDGDIRTMLGRQGLDEINPGDCVFLYTGHWDLRHPSDWDSFDVAEKARRVAAFNAGTPGFGVSACEYLAKRRVSLHGAYSWSMKRR